MTDLKSAIIKITSKIWIVAFWEGGGSINVGWFMLTFKIVISTFAVSVKVPSDTSTINEKCWGLPISDTAGVKIPETGSNLNTSVKENKTKKNQLMMILHANVNIVWK